MLRTVLAVTLFMAVYAAWQVFGWPAGHRELINDLSFVPIGLAAAVSAWAASRRCGKDLRLRWAWRLTALACASFTAGDLTWLLYTLLGKDPFPSAADGFYLLFYPLLLVGLLKQPARRQSSAAAVRLGLDVAIVAIGGAAVVVYLEVGPLLAGAGSHPLTTAFSVAYPVGDMILLLGLASVLLRGGQTVLLRLIATGLVCFVAADLVYGYTSIHGAYQSGDPVDAVWMAAMAFFAIAAAAQSTPTSRSEQAVHEIRSASWLPYVGLAAPFCLLLVAEDHLPLFPDLALVLASMLLTAIVSMRQLLTQRDLVQARRQLHHDSLHDGLTGLANRTLLVERAQWMLARARRHGSGVAALYVDIDDFKAINDNFGHAAGDDVLRAFAARLSAVARASDVAGRLGGDEFVVLLDDVKHEDEAVRIAQRIDRLLETPIESAALPGKELRVVATVGVAVTSTGTFDELLSDADRAMYEVKRSRKRSAA